MESIMVMPPELTIPTFLTTAQWLYRPFPFLKAAAKQHPDGFTASLAVLGRAAVFFHPNAVKEVFTLGPNDILTGPVNAVLRPIVGENSLLLLDGAEHLRQRKLLLPPLHGERMASYGKRMVSLTNDAIDRFPSHGAFPIHEHLQRVTLDVILRVVFGIEEGARMAEMRERIQDLMDIGTNTLLLFPAMQKHLFGLGPWPRFVKAKQALDDLLFDEIRRRQETGARGDDILSLLLDAKDDDGRTLSPIELRDELLTLLVAGHETTATSLSWALRWVLESKSLLARLSRELDDYGILPNLDPEKIAEAPLLDATIREALRLQPVIPIVGRILQRPMRIGGYDIEQGQRVLVSIYLVHQRPELYPDPERFDPDRFLRQKFSPFEWLPFGGGIRRCIGMAFALYEMKMVLATLLARTSLRLPRFARVREVRRNITVAPSGGMPVVMERAAEPRRASAVA